MITKSQSLTFKREAIGITVGGKEAVRYLGVRYIDYKAPNRLERILIERWNADKWLCLDLTMLQEPEVSSWCVVNLNEGNYPRVPGVTNYSSKELDQVQQHTELGPAWNSFWQNVND